MLVPDPAKRATIDEVLADLWLRGIETCGPGARSRTHEHLAFQQAMALKGEGQPGFQAPASIPQAIPQREQSDDEATLHPQNGERMTKQWSGGTTGTSGTCDDR